MGRRDRKRIDRNAQGGGEPPVRSRKQQKQRPEDRFDGELNEALHIVDAWADVEDQDLITIYQQLPSILRLRAQAMGRSQRTSELPQLDRLAAALERGCAHATSLAVRAAAWEATHSSCLAASDEAQSLCDALVGRGAHVLACSQLTNAASSIPASAIGFLHTACEADAGRGEAAAAIGAQEVQALVGIVASSSSSASDASAASDAAPVRRNRARAAALELLLLLSDPTAADDDGEDDDSDDEGGGAGGAAAKKAAAGAAEGGRVEVASMLADSAEWRAGVAALMSARPSPEDGAPPSTDSEAAAGADAAGAARGKASAAREQAARWELACLAAALATSVSWADGRDGGRAGLAPLLQTAVSTLVHAVAEAARAATASATASAAVGATSVEPPDEAMRPCLEALSNLLVARSEAEDEFWAPRPALA